MDETRTRGAEREGGGRVSVGEESSEQPQRAWTKEGIVPLELLLGAICQRDAVIIHKANMQILPLPPLSP